MKKRNVIALKKWMLSKGIRQVDIERETGVDQPSINKTINGTRNYKVVLLYLLARGCPKKHLALHAGMDTEKAVLSR